MSYQPRYADDFITQALAAAERRLADAKNAARARKGLPSAPAPSQDIPPRAPVAWTLTPTERRLYEILARPGWKRRVDVERELYGDLVTSPAALSLALGRLREKLEPLGIHVPKCSKGGQMAPLSIVGGGE